MTNTLDLAIHISAALDFEIRIFDSLNFVIQFWTSSPSFYFDFLWTSRVVIFFLWLYSRWAGFCYRMYKGILFYHFDKIFELARHEAVHAVFFMISRTELNTKKTNR